MRLSLEHAFDDRLSVLRETPDDLIARAFITFLCVAMQRMIALTIVFSVASSVNPTLVPAIANASTAKSTSSAREDVGAKRSNKCQKHRGKRGLAI